MRRPALVLVPLVLLALAAPVASAATPPRTVRLISGGTANTAAQFDLMAASGSRVVFHTTEALVPQDTNGVADAYARDKNGTLQLIGTGTSAAGSQAVAISADGDRVIYSTTTGDLPTDTDGAADLYERRRNGSLRLISTSGAATGVAFIQASSSGGDVIFTTTESIPGTGDGDGGQTDAFDRRADGSLRLVTPGTAVSIGFGFGGRQLSGDGSLLTFDTTEGLVPADVDGVSDTYTVRTSGGPYTLVTSGTTDGVSAVMNRAATRWWYQTTSKVLPADTDTTLDTYERRADGSLRLITGGIANTAAFLSSARDDGSSVVFVTAEKLVPSDGDTTGLDLYERRADGSLRLITGGSVDANSASYVGTNPDGSVLFFSTDKLLPADTDTFSDLYIRRPNGTLTLATPGTPAGFSASWWTTASVNERARTLIDLFVDIPGSGDTNGAGDAYEVTGDGFRPLVLGVPAGTSSTSFQTADGSRLAFTTSSTIPGTGDSDTATDVYEADFAVPVIAGVPTMAGNARVASPQTCSTPGVTGEGLTNTFSWFRDASAILGATGKTYKPVLADAGHRLRCRFTSANGIGADTADSVARKVPPAAKTPKLGGFPIVGTKLSCTSFAGATRTTYKWKRGSKTVRGRTTRTYKVARADLGKRVSCSAVARNGTLSTSVSQRVTVPRQCKVPNVRGLTPADAKTRLGNAGCRSTTRRISGSGVPVGRVLGTSPGRGKKRANGARITINVRK